MSLVLDTSVTIAWLYQNENTPEVLACFERVKRDGAHVPSLWKLEVANVLQMNVVRKRHADAFAVNALSDLSAFSIRIDRRTDEQAWSATRALAIRHRLTLYDASYLELAQRRGLPLASLDRDLRNAAAAENVTLLGK